MADGFDVLICGAGPGGAYTALRLARNGVNVGLFERSDLGRDKSCGAGLTFPVSTFEDIFSHDAPYIESACSRAILYAENGMGVEGRWEEPIYWNTRRSVFDTWLMERAIEEGAHFLPNHRVTKIKSGASGVSFTSNGEEFTGKIAVGAGGANCPVGRHLRTSLGFWEKWPARSMATSVVQEIPFPREFLAEHYAEGLSMLHINFGRLKMGYGWVFPKKDTLNIGFGALTEEIKQLDVRDTFWEYLRILEDQGHIPHLPEEINYHGAPIPYYAGLKTTVMDGVLLVGDAAGFVNPINGEGIAYALESGKFAAHAIELALKKGDFSSASLTQYENTWKAAFERELKSLLRFYPWFYRHSPLVVHACQKSRRYTNLLADVFVSRVQADKVSKRMISGAGLSFLKPVRRRRTRHGELATRLYREKKKRNRAKKSRESHSWCCVSDGRLQ